MSSPLDTFSSGMLRGQGAVVTGGSRGIGRATCLALAEAGAQVVVGYHRDRRAAEGVCEEAARTGAGGTLVPMQVDVSQPKQVYRFMEQATAAISSLHILVNCAGTWPQAQLQDLDDQDWSDTLAINLSGTFYACKAAGKTMMGQQRGNIVNFSSIAAVRGAQSGHAHYAAAKGGVASLTRTLANELGPHNINVNAVAPGVIRTDMTAEALNEREQDYCQQTALGRIGLPKEVAGAVLFLVSPAAAYVTGQILHVNGGMWMS
jgi:3-oxoacyl-[acyl-carrier protein] reductase